MRARARVAPLSTRTHPPRRCRCGFPAPYGSDTFLEPTDPLYVTLGAAFNQAVLAAFGDPSAEEVRDLLLLCLLALRVCGPTYLGRDRRPSSTRTSSTRWR